MYTYKVMIHPNNKQETKLRRTLNKCIECNNVVYDYLDSFVKEKKPFPKCSDVRKWFTIQKKIKDNEVLEKRIGLNKKEIIQKHLDTCFYDVSNDALKQEVKDTYNSFIRFFKKLSKYPTRKKYSSYKKSFYIDPYKIGFTDKKVRLEKIANNQKENRLILNLVSLAERNRIPVDVRYFNPRVILEGDRFFVVVSVTDEYSKTNKEIIIDKDKTIGIDININSIVTSDNVSYQTPSRLLSYKKINKRIKREQRKLSKKYEISKVLKKKLSESKNYIKQKRKKNKYNVRLNNIKKSCINDIISNIIKTGPNKICLETLDVNEMKTSNKFVAKGIQNNPFRDFITKLSLKAKKYNITIAYADKYYSSSKICNKCGYKKKDLTLNDRIFICPNCGLKINRDYNAAINLRNYALK